MTPLDPLPWLLLAIGVVVWWGYRHVTGDARAHRRPDQLVRAIVTAIVTSACGGLIAPRLGHTAPEGALYGLIEGLAVIPVGSWLHDAAYRARSWLRRGWRAIGQRFGRRHG